jgi:hypothetical protein
VVFLSPVLMGFLLVGLGALGRTGRGKRLWAVVLLLVLGGVLCFRALVPGFLADVLTLGGLIPGIYARGLLWGSLSALIAAGAGRLVVPAGAERWTVLRQFLLGVVAYAGLSWASYLDGEMIHLGVRRDLLALYGVLLTLLVGGLLAPAGLLRRLLVGAGLAIAVVCPVAEIAPGLRYYDRFNALDPLAGGPPAILGLEEATREDPHLRFAAAMPNPSRSPDLSPNMASVWRARDVRLVDALVLRRFANLHQDLLPEKPPFAATWFAFRDVPRRELGLLGVGRFAEVEDPGRAGFRWAQISPRLTRAFLAHRLLPARTEEESRRRWLALSRTPEAYETAVIEGWEGPADIGAGEPSDGIEWIADSRSEVRLQVSSAQGAMLVLLDSYASGWRAYLDGKQARIYPANLAFRGLPVPPGTHVVAFRYRPASIFAGAGLSAAGWLVVAGLACAGIARRRAGASGRVSSMAEGPSP